MTVIVILAVVALCVVLYIMLNQLGLSPDYDFGAGAYYYADIPDYDKIEVPGAYVARLPGWIYYVLFFAWGALMWALWKWVDGRK